MQGKTKFILFIFILLIGFVLVFIWRKTNSIDYIYTHKIISLDYSNKKELGQEKKLFIDSICRAAQYSNASILLEKKQFDKINQLYEEKYSINKHHLQILHRLSKKYLVKDFPKESDTLAMLSFFDKLRSKIQIVPVRLTIAQAILESAWGTSRFATEGHAFFGILCYSEGCGILLNTNQSKKYVKSYSNLQESVDDYMLFLNSKRGSRKFRIARLKYLSSDEKDISLIVNSLTFYSEIGGDYQKILNDLLKNYIPDQIDDY